MDNCRATVTTAEGAAALEDVAALLHALPDSLLVLDLAGRIVRCNHRAEDVTGLSEAQLCGRLGIDLVAAEERTAVQMVLQAAMATGSAAIEAHFVRPMAPLGASACTPRRCEIVEARSVDWSLRVVKDVRPALVARLKSAWKRRWESCATPTPN